MKLFYKGLKLDIEQWSQEDYGSFWNSWVSTNLYSYSYADSTGYVTVQDINNLLVRNKVKCVIRDSEALKELMTRINNEPEQEALIRLSEGDYKIHNVTVDNVNTSFSLEGELETRITFSYTGEMEYVEGSRLGFFKDC